LHSADGVLDRFFRPEPITTGVAVRRFGPAVGPLAVGDEEGQGRDAVEVLTGVGLDGSDRFLHGPSISFRGGTLHRGVAFSTPLLGNGLAQAFEDPTVVAQVFPVQVAQGCSDPLRLLKSEVDVDTEVTVADEGS